MGMKNKLRTADALLGIVFLAFSFFFPVTIHASNDVMGEVELEGRSSVEKTSGVWIDGTYVGYLKELKGSKKVLLLPGDHVITVRQDGYQDFTQKVVAQPGQKLVIRVAMQRGITGNLPAVMATVKIAVNPSRAAVFVDGLFVGHVGEFEGWGRGMLVAPGKHRIKLALPGYQTFETEISVIANQKVEIKTDLAKSDAPMTGPLSRRCKLPVGRFRFMFYGLRCLRRSPRCPMLPANLEERTCCLCVLAPIP